MTVRYFKKFDTRQPLMTGGGGYIPFEQLTADDGKLFEWGVLATNNGYVISELERFILRQAGGVAEISASDYEQLKKKEHLTLLPSWRQTIDAKHYLLQILRLNREADVAASKAANLPEVVRGLRGEKQHLSRPLGVSDFRPKAVARA